MLESMWTSAHLTTKICASYEPLFPPTACRGFINVRSAEVRIVFFYVLERCISDAQTVLQKARQIGSAGRVLRSYYSVMSPEDKRPIEVKNQKRQRRRRSSSERKGRGRGSRRSPVRLARPATDRNLSYRIIGLPIGGRAVSLVLRGAIDLFRSVDRL